MEKEAESLRAYDRKRKAKIRSRRIILITLIAIIGCFAMVFYYSNKNLQYKDYSILATVPASRTGDVSFVKYRKGVMRYTRDGAMAVMSDGELLWNGSYQMKDPIASVCSSYAAIADRGGYEVHIFNEKGFINTFTTIYPIKKICVAGQGATSVLMEQDSEYIITLYDKEGTTLAEMPITTSLSGYPIDMAFSFDGRKLALSCLSVNEGALQTNIGFYNFGEVGQNKTDRFTGGYKIADEMVPMVTFIDNDTVCIYRKKQIDLYQYRELPKAIDSMTYENDILSALHNDQYFGVITTDGNEKKQLLLYNTSGDTILNQTVSFPYQEVYLADSDVVFKGANAVRIIRVNGTLKYEGIMDHTLRALYPASGIDEYLFIDEEAINVVRLLKETKEAKYEE